MCSWCSKSKSLQFLTYKMVESVLPAGEKYIVSELKVFCINCSACVLLAYFLMRGSKKYIHVPPLSQKGGACIHFTKKVLCTHKRSISKADPDV